MLRSSYYDDLSAARKYVIKSLKSVEHFVFISTPSKNRVLPFLPEYFAWAVKLNFIDIGRMKCSALLPCASNPYSDNRPLVTPQEFLI